MPQPIERSTYVLLSCVVLAALMIWWQPIGIVVWDLPAGPARWAMWTLFAAGWLMVPLVTLMISHFDLFGTRQVWLHLRGQEYTSLPFRTPMLYSKMRHPLYVGWTIAFWAIPTMTVGHLLLAALLTGYMLIAVGLRGARPGGPFRPGVRGLPPPGADVRAATLDRRRQDERRATERAARGTVGS